MGAFDRIVCGVDGSDESLEAVRQCSVLLEPRGRLVLAAVVDLAEAVHFQVAATPLHAARRALAAVEELEEAAAAALERARAEAGAVPVETVVTGGRPARCLFDAAEAEDASLLAVGTHGRGRAAGILLGSVATRVLDGAPRSVLVARGPAAGRWSPGTVVLGVDGSGGDAAARRVGGELEARLGAQVRELALADGAQAHALVVAAAAADLLVVASRREHGRRRLLSVAEHVAHDARCSVVVVREPNAARSGGSAPPDPAP